MLCFPTLSFFAVLWLVQHTVGLARWAGPRPYVQVEALWCLHRACSAVHSF